MPYNPRRRFTEEEVMQGIWVKLGSQGNSFRVRFLPDADFEERWLFGGTGESWHGKWSIDYRGYLEMEVSKYRLTVQPDPSGGTMHSGEELVTDGSLEPPPFTGPSYLHKVAPSQWKPVNAVYWLIHVPMGEW